LSNKNKIIIWRYYQHYFLSQGSKINTTFVHQKIGLLMVNRERMLAAVGCSYSEYGEGATWCCSCCALLY
jgi:hypothetical protein